MEMTVDKPNETETTSQDLSDPNSVARELGSVELVYVGGGMANVAFA